MEPPYQLRSFFVERAGDELHVGVVRHQQAQGCENLLESVLEETTLSRLRVHFLQRLAVCEHVLLLLGNLLGADDANSVVNVHLLLRSCLDELVVDGLGVLETFKSSEVAAAALEVLDFLVAEQRLIAERLFEELMEGPAQKRLSHHVVERELGTILVFRLRGCRALLLPLAGRGPLGDSTARRGLLLDRLLLDRVERHRAC
mmetsp:Transcript_12381/g.49628  ORF Transcript_12381/g.49628 Transcript_12381/m.49628 type:complete len:202 (-) Transcript_12381:47-652(-)